MIHRTSSFFLVLLLVTPSLVAVDGSLGSSPSGAAAVEDVTSSESDGGVQESGVDSGRSSGTEPTDAPAPGDQVPPAGGAALGAASDPDPSAPTGPAVDDGVLVPAELVPVVDATRIIVVYEDGVDAATRQSVIEGTVDDVVAVQEATETVVGVEVGGDGIDAAELVELAGDPAVRFVEEDHSLFLVDDGSTWDPDTYRRDSWGMRGPNDTGALIPESYGANVVQAWRAGHTGVTAAGVERIWVGVIDTGIDTRHPDLSEKIWLNENEIPLNRIDEDENTYFDDYNGWNAAERGGMVDPHGPSMENSYDHGTLVSGIIAAQGGNGTQMAGVNWGAGIIPSRLFSAMGGATTIAAIDAIDYLTFVKQNMGANIVAINASWGGDGYSKALEEAINRAGDAGILFVAGAGNTTRNLDVRSFWPASYSCVTPQRSWDCVITVAAHRRDGQLASFSSYGSRTVELSAPGEAVYSITPWTERGHAVFGTSFSTPYVTGAISLCASVNPDMDPGEIREALLATAAPDPNLTGKVITGARLDVAAMMQRCENPGASVGALTSVKLAGLRTLSVGGWLLPGDAAGGGFSVTLNGEETATLDGLRSSVGMYGRVDLAADIAAPPGLVELCLRDGSGTEVDCREFYVPEETEPFGSFDVAPKANGKYRVSGWALDPKNPDRPKVSLYINGELQAELETQGGAGSFPVDTYVGWDPERRTYSFEWSSQPGRHTACVVASSVDGQDQTELGCYEYHQIAGNDPVGAVSSVERARNGNIQVEGWALDPDADGVTQVHVYANGRMVGSGQTGGANAAVAAQYPGYQTGPGFSVTVPPAQGSERQRVCVFAINKAAGTTNPILGCGNIVVRGGNPFGSIDVARGAGPGSIRVAGWAIDPDTADPVDVHVYVNGRGWALTADRNRPDIGRVFPGYGSGHGFDRTLTGLRGGRNSVCVFAINTGVGTTNPLIGCRDAFLEL